MKRVREGCASEATSAGWAGFLRGTPGARLRFLVSGRHASSSAERTLSPSVRNRSIRFVREHKTDIRVAVGLGAHLCCTSTLSFGIQRTS